MKKKINKTINNVSIEKEWEMLPANCRDGFYAKRGGFEHTQSHQERLQFIKDKIKEREEEIIKTIELINETNPVYESDDYDRGRKDMKEEIIDKVKTEQLKLN